MCIFPKCVIPNNRPSSCRYKPHRYTGFLPSCIHYNAPHVHIADGLCLRSDSLNHRDARDGGYGNIILHRKCIIFLYTCHKFIQYTELDFNDSNLLVKCICQSCVDWSSLSLSNAMFPPILLSIPIKKTIVYMQGRYMTHLIFNAYIYNIKAVTWISRR